MAQRSDEEIVAAREAYIAHLPVMEVPVPKATMADGIALEVQLDIRETMNKILVLLGGTP